MNLNASPRIGRSLIASALPFLSGILHAGIDDRRITEVDPSGDKVEVTHFSDSLTAPLGVVDPADGSGRLFIYEQTGFIRILRNGIVEPTPFLDVEVRTVSENPGYDERGLIGFTLHPDFAGTRLALGLNARNLGGWVKGFGQDASGEIYLCTSDQLAPTGSGGKVRRFIPLVHITAFEHTGANLRIEVLADEDGGTVSLKKSTDLTGFPVTVPLTPLAPSLYEALVPTIEPKAFFRGELRP